MAAPSTVPEFIERQLPAGDEIFLDHIAHFVPDQRAATDAMTRAGFAPTPVSIQTNPGPSGAPIPAGTGNITAMMARGYIEVLFKTSETPLTREFDDNLTRYPGPHLIAFSVADAAAASKRLFTAGFHAGPLVALRRPVGTETGTAEAAFTVARVIPGEMREGRIQYLTHHTEDAVWQKRWLNHPNGANALIDAVVAVDDVDEAAARFARFLGREAVPTNMGRGFFLERGGVQLVNAAAFARLVPEILVPSLPFIGVYGLRVVSLTVADNLLSANGVAAIRRGGVLAVPFPTPLGVGAWMFVERPEFSSLANEKLIIPMTNKKPLSVSVGPSMVSTLPFTTRPEIDGIFGVVASTHWIATAVGMSILERGGNAFDAAVATAFTLQIVEPHLNGPGGDVPVLVYDVNRGKPEVLCGQGPAPAAASIAKFHALGLDMVPGSGLLAACVPGTFETWMMLLRDYGTMRVRDVLEPAIFYAREGQPLVERASETIATVQSLFRDHWKTSAAVWMPDGRVPAPATLIKNPALAATYERILKEAESAKGGRDAEIEAARAAWSRGFVAEAIDKFCRTQEAMDTSGSPHRGLLTGADMAAWAPSIDAPATYDYGRFTVCKAGFWSQGPVLLQQLALLKGFDLDGLDPAGPDFIHYQVEAVKLAFADRDTFYGDPDFVSVPDKILLSDNYNAERRALIGDRANMELRPGRIDGFGGTLRIGKAAPAGAMGAGEPTTGSLGGGEPTVGRLGAAAGDTVHFDIIDRAGNMVSSTPSGGWLQSSPLIPELGFCLGTRAQMFWLDESHPASLAPGKRPRSTLSPTLALRDGKPHLVWGSPGGDQQDQWSCQFLLRYAHAGHNLQQSIDAPAWHTEHFPASFWPRAARPGVVVVEKQVPEATVTELRRRGHIVEVGMAWSEGRLTAASRDGIRRKAAANPRGMQGYAAGR